MSPNKFRVEIRSSQILKLHIKILCNFYTFNVIDDDITDMHIFNALLLTTKQPNPESPKPLLSLHHSVYQVLHNYDYPLYIHNLRNASLFSTTLEHSLLANQLSFTHLMQNLQGIKCRSLLKHSDSQAGGRNHNSRYGL